MRRRADLSLRLSLRLVLLAGTGLGGLGVGSAALAADDAASGGALLAANDASAADAGPIGGHVPDATRSSVESLYLIAVLGGTPTDQFITTRRQADGSLSFRAGDLRAVRLKIDASFAADDMIPAAKLPDIDFHYDDARQVLEIHAPDRLVEPFHVGMDTGREALNLADIKPLTGLLLNYGLYTTAYQGKVSLTGNVEADVLSRYGTFATTGAFATDSRYNGSVFVRQDSYWRYIDPNHVRSYTIGDFNSNAQTWTSAVRLGGFQFSSAFEQRPDLVTNALPQFSGSAALPSTVDLYVNQQKIYSGEVPSGPFDIKNLPTTANGNVSMVATDANGRQIAITKPFYYVQGQLKQGLLQYSLDVGAPRLEYGNVSDSYDDVVFTSGNVKYGLTRNLTVEGAVQGSSDGLAMGGVGIVTPLWGRGALHASIAGSHYQGMSGGKYAVRVEGRVGGINYFASTERTFGDYFDLGRVSVVRSLRRGALEDGSLTAAELSAQVASSAMSRITDQAGISFQPWFDKTSIGLTYNHMVTSTTTIQTANFSLSRSLGPHISLSASGFTDLNNSRNYGAFLMLSFRPTQRTNATAQYNNNAGSSTWNLQYASTNTARQNELSWGANYSGGESGGSTERGYLSYRASDAFIRAEVDHSDTDWRGEVDVEGSVIVAGGGVFPANRVTNGFAIVENGGPHVDVMQGGQRLARTDGSGRALLPDVTPYMPTHYFIDPVSLPDGWEPLETERVAVVGFKQGTVVDFGTRPIHGATIVLLGKDGKPIPAGYTATIEGGASATVGYDGSVYLEGLQATNKLSVDLGPAGVCKVSFSYNVKIIALQKIGPLTCQ